MKKPNPSTELELTLQHQPGGEGADDNPGNPLGCSEPWRLPPSLLCGRSPDDDADCIKPELRPGDNLPR